MSNENQQLMGSDGMQNQNIPITKHFDKSHTRFAKPITPAFRKPTAPTRKRPAVPLEFADEPPKKKMSLEQQAEKLKHISFSISLGAFSKKHEELRHVIENKIQLVEEKNALISSTENELDFDEKQILDEIAKTDASPKLKKQFKVMFEDKKALVDAHMMILKKKLRGEDYELYSTNKKLDDFFKTMDFAATDTRDKNSTSQTVIERLVEEKAALRDQLYNESGETEYHRRESQKWKTTAREFADQKKNLGKEIKDVKKTCENKVTELKKKLAEAESELAAKSEIADLKERRRPRRNSF